MEFDLRRRIAERFRKPKGPMMRILPEISEETLKPGNEVDFTQLRIDRARLILEGALLSPAQRKAIEDLVAGERERAHVQTNLAWELTLNSAEGVDLEDGRIAELRRVQEELYEQRTSKLGVSYSNLEYLEGTRDLD